MGLFGNQPPQKSLPVDAVNQLRTQNRSDHEIIDALSQQGYSSIDIYNALNQADAGASQQNQPAPQGGQPAQGYAQDPYASQQSEQDPYGSSAPQQDQYAPPQQDAFASQQSEQDPYAQNDRSAPQPTQNDASWQDPQSDWNAGQSEQPQPAPQGDDPWSGQNIVHAQPSSQPPQPPQPPQQPAPQAPPNQTVFQGTQSAPAFGSDATIDQIDQVAEAIIDEKWKDMKAYIEKIIDWKGKVENRILAIEENQKMLNQQIVGLQKSMLEKVQTYDRHITDVGTEIKAMEKVFQKIIPSLTDNVNELSSVVHRMKDEQ